jgi:Family of unknown function (DUF6496)
MAIIEENLKIQRWPQPCERQRRWRSEHQCQEESMARYSRSASKEVKSALHREKKGTLKSGKGGKGGTVKSRKQAVAIALSEARAKGKKVPKRKIAKKKTAKKKTARKKAAKKKSRR